MDGRTGEKTEDDEFSLVCCKKDVNGILAASVGNVLLKTSPKATELTIPRRPVFCPEPFVVALFMSSTSALILTD